MSHFGFGGPDMERLVAGRERIYLDRFWNELSRDPKRFDEAKRQHYAARHDLLELRGNARPEFTVPQDVSCFGRAGTAETAARDRATASSTVPVASRPPL